MEDRLQEDGFPEGTPQTFPMSFSRSGIFYARVFVPFIPCPLSVPRV